MMTTPVMASPIDDRDQFYDDIYDAYYNAIREHRMKDKWNGDLGKVWMDVATDTDHKEFGLWSFWNIQMWHSAMV